MKDGERTEALQQGVTQTQGREACEGPRRKFDKKHGEFEGSPMSEPTKREPSQSELDQHGVRRVPADAFLWVGYRYTHARDAVAAAKRAEKE